MSIKNIIDCVYLVALAGCLDLWRMRAVGSQDVPCWYHFGGMAGGEAGIGQGSLEHAVP